MPSVHFLRCLLLPSPSLRACSCELLLQLGAKVNASNNAGDR
jgi:hypothetical protein